MKDKKNLVDAIDNLFNDVPLDNTVSTLKTRVLNFLESEIVDFEQVPEEGVNQEKFTLIEFE